MDSSIGIIVATFSLCLITYFVTSNRWRVKSYRSNTAKRYRHRADCTLALSQWETALRCLFLAGRKPRINPATLENTWSLEFYDDQNIWHKTWHIGALVFSGVVIADLIKQFASCYNFASCAGGNVVFLTESSRHQTLIRIGIIIFHYSINLLRKHRVYYVGYIMSNINVLLVISMTKTDAKRKLVLII